MSVLTSIVAGGGGSGSGGIATITAGSQIHAVTAGSDVTISSDFFFDATVGASGADYTTVKAAIDAGKVSILVISSVTESANITIPGATSPNVLLYIKEGVTLSLSTFRFLNTGALVAVYIRGEGVISYAHTTVNQEAFDLTAGVVLDHQGVTITNTSNQDGCSYATSGVVQRIRSCVLNLPNKQGGGFTSADSKAYFDDIEVVGGGSACEDGMDVDFANITNLYVRGTFITQASGNALLIQDSNISNVIFEHTTNPINVAAYFSFVDNLTTNSPDNQALTLDNPSTIVNVFEGISQLHLFGCAIVSNAEVHNVDNGNLSDVRYTNVSVLGTIDFSDVASSTGHYSACRFVNLTSIAGDHNGFDNCVFHPTVTTASGADYNRFVGCKVGAGLGTETFSITAGSIGTIIIGSTVDAAISDAGTGTVLVGNIIY